MKILYDTNPLLANAQLNIHLQQPLYPDPDPEVKCNK